MPVLVLIADGVRADTLARSIDRGALPAMSRMRTEGGQFDVTSTFPSVTGPAYTPFLMGRFPGSIGLPGLRWFDRSREACSFPDYSRSYVGYQMASVNRDIDPSAPTIFELVPDSVGALSMITRGLPRRRQLASLTPRSALRAARTHFRGDLRGWLGVDRDVSANVIESVRADTPAYVFAAFTGVDKVSHARGQSSEIVLDALRIIDDTIAAVREDLERRGLWGDTHIWVASDHGHSPVHHHEDLANLVRTLGFRVMAHPWVYRPGADAAVMVSGNAMAHIYTDLESRDRPFWEGMSSDARALFEEVRKRPSVDLVLVPVDCDRCDVWGGASASQPQRGRASVIRDGDRYSYVADEGDPLGVGRSLCHVSAAEAHEATVATDYPDSVVQIAKLASSARAGDMILSAARDWDFRARYEPIPHVSSHGALHRDHMMVPLLLSRRPARPPRRTTDIMPSALAALRLPVPAGLDGESFI
jgi:hypothetical protein